MKSKKLLVVSVSFIAKSSLSCTHDSKTYSVGTTDIHPSRPPCQRCQCQPNSLYAKAGKLTCHAIQCPALHCASPSTPAGECCARCACDGGVEFTNCPSGDVRVPLPSSRDEVLYQFSAATHDCRGQSRSITTSKTPQGDIYTWNGGAGHQITVTASVAGTSDSVTCSFKLIPEGKSHYYTVTSVGYLLYVYQDVYSLQVAVTKTRALGNYVVSLK